MFKILPLSNRVKRQIRELRPSEKGKLRTAFHEIELDPYGVANNRINKFKGDLVHLGWHYELSYGYRIHYKINEASEEIKITYIGPHPKY